MGGNDSCFVYLLGAGLHGSSRPPATKGGPAILTHIRTDLSGSGDEAAFAVGAITLAYETPVFRVLARA